MLGSSATFTDDLNQARCAPRNIFNYRALRCLLGLLCLLLSFEAPAQTKPRKLTPAEATKMSRTAEQHYKLQEYEEALEIFKELYRQTNEPTLLFNIGQCYRQLGQYDKALKSYQTFLQDNPTSPLAPNAEQRIVEVEAAIQAEIAKTLPASTQATSEPVKEAPTPAPQPLSLGRPLYTKAIISGSLAGTFLASSLLVFSREKKLSAEVEQDQASASLNDVKEVRRLEIASVALGAVADVLTVGAGVFVWKGVKKSREGARVTVSPTSASLTIQF